MGRNRKPKNPVGEAPAALNESIAQFGEQSIPIIGNKTKDNQLGRRVRWNPKREKGVVKVNNIEDAYEQILRGNYVEMDTKQEAYTLVKELGDYVKKVEAATGQKVPNLDLCRVSVPGTNLFCGSSVATDRYPNGIPRQQMPQLSGEPIPGTPADALPRETRNGVPTKDVDVGPAFIKALQDMGVKTTEKRVAASSLKASQHQLRGTGVSGFLTPSGLAALDSPSSIIYVSRDGYVIDGHHRWAAQIARDLADGRTGDVKMNVRMIDMPIMEVLDAALDFTNAVGIKPMTA